LRKEACLRLRHRAVFHPGSKFCQYGQAGLPKAAKSQTAPRAALPPWKDPEVSGKVSLGGCSHPLVFNRGEVNKAIPACQPQGRPGIAMTANSETRVPKLVSGLSIFF
jgi:hypothetical protein